MQQCRMNSNEKKIKKDWRKRKIFYMKKERKKRYTNFCSLPQMEIFDKLGFTFDKYEEFYIEDRGIQKTLKNSVSQFTMINKQVTFIKKDVIA